MGLPPNAVTRWTILHPRRVLSETYINVGSRAPDGGLGLPSQSFPTVARLEGRQGISAYPRVGGEGLGSEGSESAGPFQGRREATTSEVSETAKIPIVVRPILPEARQTL